MGKESMGCLVFAGKEDQTRQEADQPKAEMVSTKGQPSNTIIGPTEDNSSRNKGPSVYPSTIYLPLVDTWDQYYPPHIMISQILYALKQNFIVQPMR